MMVSPGPEREIHNPVTPAVFRRIHSVLDLELLDGLIWWAGFGDETWSADVLHIDAVDQHFLAESGGTVDGLLPLSARDPRRQENEILDLPPAGGARSCRSAEGNWQVEDGLGRHDRAYLRRGGLEFNRASRDCYRFIYLTDRQREIHG